MISKSVVEALEKFVQAENIHIQESMAAHTTFRVGGPADCLVEIENEIQLQRVQNYLQQVGVPYFVLGNGSNLLVSDKGYRGVILQIGRRMSQIKVTGKLIVAQAGALLSQVAKEAMKHGLAGMEFASGIPGTVGGAVVMNAGAYDGEMRQIVKEVTVLNQENELMKLENETMEFGYRTSVIKNHPFIVTEVVFVLQPGEQEDIKARMDELAVKRREKQPLEYPSAGSTFKRPEGHFAGKLIMDAGLRGYQVGGAQVSEKHCGFIVNAGNATADDVMQLIREVKTCVKEQFEVDLEPEVVFLGDF
ncbi:MAG: UDP-N-acetylmuramate dehydrogenase [Lachnospiraceae bacterium]|nr:UDP-N-acetylmuramate dehydrogenase [Lachnospiraceae bacterium]